jgi:hypothetical protein
MPNVFLCARLTLFVVMSAVACRDDGPTLPSRVWTAKIHGTVTDSQGNRVPNADVTLRSLSIRSAGFGADTLGTCVGDLLTPQMLRADARGDYSYTWQGAAIPAFVCIAVDAVGTRGEVRLSGTTHVDSITLHPLAIDDLQILVKVRPF